ncbi:hypothetical protein LINPERPRIM_LOCUS14244 [Linum perenne]
MHPKAQTRVESGTCNVCSTPCSSCMHRKRAFMGSKGDEGDEFSDETCHVAETSQNSINKDESSPAKGGTRDTLRPATSAASNVPSVDSCQDALSETAEIKGNVRISDRVDVSMKPEALPESSSVGTVSVGILSPKPEFIAYKRTASAKSAASKAVEGHGDNISCVTGADGSSHGDSGSKVAIQNNNLSSNANVVNLIEDPVIQACKESSKSITECANPMLSQDAAPDILLHDNLAVHNGADNNLKSRSVTQGDGPEVSSKFGQEIKEEIGNASGAQPDVGITSSAKVEEDEKKNETVELPHMRESPAESSSANEGDDSESGEQDVKVCDICGDSGQEEKLAFCSRCSDGAEHTYCMKEMVLEVPDGDWLCEECKLAEESENQKQGSEGKDANKLNFQRLKKRPAETVEVAAIPKRQAVDMGSGSPKPLSPVKVATLQRNSSSRSWDKEKIKPSHPVNDITESTRPRLQSPKGTFLKSNSFNATSSKPKVKLVDELPHKSKSFKESSLADNKDGPGRMMGKSMSFHYAGSGKAESKVKMLPSKLSHVQDIKGVKQARDHNTFERRNLSKLDRPGGMVAPGSKITTPKPEQKLTPRNEGVTVSSAGNSRDLYAAASEGRLGSLSRSNAGITRKGDGPGTSVRASSVHGSSTVSIERTANQVPKDEPSPSTSSSAERPLDTADENSHDGLLRPQKSLSQGEKSRASSVSRTRPASAVALKETGNGRKRKDIGHSGENSTSNSPRGPVSDAPVTKSVGDEISRDSKLKAAIEVAMLKRPGIYRKKVDHARPDGLSSSNIDVNSHKDPQAKFPVSNRHKTATFDEPAHEEKPIPGPWSTDLPKQTNVETLNLSNTHTASAVFPLKVDLDTLGSFAGRSGHIPPTSVEKASPIPEHNFIWQGTFEVNRGGKITNIYGGIQAHLSTWASSKVLEVVNKFPENIRLDEVSRSSTWPRQFHEVGTTGDNIALYFFAKDLESYNKHYKGLLDNAIRRDLAFKGYFDGVELLIFPSTQLPEDSQRWNMMFFLWGVFKGRKSSPDDCLRKPVVTSLNVVAQGEEMPVANVSSPANRFPPQHVERKISAVDDRCNTAVSSSDLKNTQVAENGAVDERKIDSSKPLCTLDCDGATNVALSNQVRSSSATASSVDISRPECRIDTEEKPSALVVESKNGFNDMEAQKLVDTSNLQGDVSKLENLQVENQDLGLRGSIVGREPAVSRKDSGGVNIVRDLNEVVDMEIETCEDRDFEPGKRKRPLLDLTELPPESPGSIIDQEMPWSKTARTVLVDEQGANKKRRTSYEGGSEYVGSGDSKSFPIVASSVEKRYDDEMSEKNATVQENTKASERFLFPVADSHGLQQDTQMRPNAIPWGRESSSGIKNEPSSSSSRHEIPNLNLALEEDETEVETVTEPPPLCSSSNGMLPFMIGPVENNTTSLNNSFPRPPVEEVKDKEESVSASLSLSLSFPFPDKEQTVTPVKQQTTTEQQQQLLPERRQQPCEYVSAPFWKLSR